MGSRVEQFEQIRRDRDREGLSIRGLAVRHGVHRRTVKHALASPVPPVKRSPVSRPARKLGPYRAVIDEWLLVDRDVPPKQRHTARRIWRRLVDEHGTDVAEVTVRQYVRARKRELGWPVDEVFVPQVHAPGVEAEVDWGEALVVLGGVSVKVHLFVMRASFSGAAFCQASLVETQQAFLELHVQAFEWFGGVFASVRTEYVPGHISRHMLRATYGDKAITRAGDAGVALCHVSDRADEVARTGSHSRLAPGTPTAIVSATIRSSALADQPCGAPAGWWRRCGSTASGGCRCAAWDDGGDLGVR